MLTECWYIDQMAEDVIGVWRDNVARLGEPEGWRSLGLAVRSLVVNIDMCLNEIELEGVDCINLA
jgi:hypothetical protein